MTWQFRVGYYPLVWALSGALLKSGFGVAGQEAQLLQSLVLYCLDAAFDTLVGLPFALWRTFVVEERHGFNKQTLPLFLSDTFKGLLLNCLIGAPLIGLFISVIGWGGDRFYLYVSALFFVVQVLAVPFYSNFIQPCFNKVVPLPEGELRTAIEALAKRIDFPLTGLYVIDGSKRSSHSNVRTNKQTNKLTTISSLSRSCWASGAPIRVVQHAAALLDGNLWRGGGFNLSSSSDRIAASSPTGKDELLVSRARVCLWPACLDSSAPRFARPRPTFSASTKRSASFCSTR